MVTTSLRQLVLESDRSVYRIAVDSGVDYSQLTGWLRGRRGLSLNSVDRICNVLQLDIVQRPSKSKN